MVIAEHLYTLGIVLLITLLYLAVIRFLDLNEREPLWSIALLFTLGFVSAGLLQLIIQSPVLQLTVLTASVLRRLSTFVAIAVGVAILSASARRQGWSELNGLMDGIVYGSAAGLGFATGEIFVRQLRTPPLALLVEFNWIVVVWTSALVGLAHGIFGGLSGAGFGAAAESSRPAGRVLYPLAGLAAAIVADAGYELLAYGNSLGGSSAAVRSWIALLLPLVGVEAIALYALRNERRTIETQLAPEVQAGVLTDADLQLIQRAGKRHLLYCTTALRGSLARCTRLISVHHCQVQLALAKQRAARESNEQRRAKIVAEVNRLRDQLSDTA